jgi:hypothetical protein
MCIFDLQINTLRVKKKKKRERIDKLVIMKIILHKQLRPFDELFINLLFIFTYILLLGITRITM